VRASEAEREAAVRDLRGHAAAGRLEVDELEERVGAAFAARTREELADLRRDLPSLPRPRQSEFRGHLRAFIAVQLLLVAIWAVAGAGYFWPIWPFMGWGIGVMVHGLCEMGKDNVWANASRRAPRRRVIGS
jgi:DUF1707 SHOCT-like domain/2TM domain